MIITFTGFIDFLMEVTLSKERISSFKEVHRSPLITREMNFRKLLLRIAWKPPEQTFKHH